MDAVFFIGVVDHFQMLVDPGDVAMDGIGGGNADFLVEFKAFGQRLGLANFGHEIALDDFGFDATILNEDILLSPSLEK